MSAHVCPKCSARIESDRPVMCPLCAIPMCSTSEIIVLEHDDSPEEVMDNVIEALERMGIVVLVGDEEDDGAVQYTFSRVSP